MKNKKNRQETSQEKLEKSLAVIFEKSEEIEFETNPRGIITIRLKQNHPIQRGMRALHVSIPEYRSIRLDFKGSFVFRNIDGNHSVKELGKLMEAEFGEDAQPIYPRLITYLDYMERQCRYIKRVY